MTLEEAFQTDKQLILTIDPPDGSASFTVTMIHPYCILPGGLLYGELQDGTDWQVYSEFISHVGLGEEIR